jgi:hypothetical protein
MSAGGGRTQGSLPSSRWVATQHNAKTLAGFTLSLPNPYLRVLLHCPPQSLLCFTAEAVHFVEHQNLEALLTCGGWGMEEKGQQS